MKDLQFITAIPWDVRKGSGCYVGTRTLAAALSRLGIGVEVIRPGITTPVYAATRLLFNESLRWRRFNSAATVGIDADGYAIPAEEIRLHTSPASKAFSATLCVSKPEPRGPASRFRRALKEDTRSAPIS